ncbi:MAG: hypothetical protein LH613_13120 [Chamaesiphon sp.]|nr:hypothetical protein [Chamaesiphon sp.]
MSIQVISELIPAIFRLVFIVAIALGSFNYLRSAWKSVKKDWQHLRRLHQIPCDRCVFFTGEYNLKCTVHPSKALKEEAIDCMDYQCNRSY